MSGANRGDVLNLGVAAGATTAGVVVSATTPITNVYFRGTIGTSPVVAGVPTPVPQVKVYGQGARALSDANGKYLIE